MQEEQASHFHSSRSWLIFHFEKRMKKNPAYSLRAFAKSINLSPSYLSRVFSGERPLSLKAFLKISETLDLDPKERKKVFNLITSENTITNGERNDEESDDPTQLTLDAFYVISEWYHFAIMQLFYIKGFKEDSTWIAKMLGISSHEVNFAFERLLRLGLIEKNKNGKLVRTSATLTTGSDIPSSGIRQFQRQILEKAILSLEQDSVEKRDITSMTMAINIKHLPRAKEEIKKFRKKMTKLLEEGERSQVYNLGIHLIPLTQNINTEKAYEH